MIRAARAFAILLLASSVVALVAYISTIVWPKRSGGALAWETYPDAATIALALSGFTFVGSAIGTASTVVLSWRKERREAVEYRLKIEHLELQLVRLRGQDPSVISPETGGQ
jgi:hypothetical protein